MIPVHHFLIVNGHLFKAQKICLNIENAVLKKPLMNLANFDFIVSKLPGVV